MKPITLIKNIAAILIVFVCIGFYHCQPPSAAKAAEIQPCNSAEREAPASANDFIFLQSISRNIVSVNLP